MRQPSRASVYLAVVPRRTDGSGPPNSHVVAGEWPEAELDGDPGAAYAQAIARALRDALADRSRRAVAREAGVIADVTIGAALRGDNYIDIRTLAALESSLGVRLLPDWAKRRSRS